MLVRDNLWRHLIHETGGGDGGNGDGSTGFPYGPGDPPPGYGQPSSNEPSYPTGPSTQSSYQNASPPASKPAPPPNMWDGVSSAIQSQSEQDVDNFEKLVGGAPKGFNSEQWANWLAKSGTNVGGSNLDAYEWLFNNVLTDDQRKNNQWARYGMDKDLYKTTVAKLDATYSDWTGQSLSSISFDSGGSLLYNAGLFQAIRENWLPDQIRNFAMYGNPEGTGPLLAQAQFSGDMPWLSQGQTYSATLQQFEALEQHMPTDKSTLAAFWRFGTGAKQLGGSQEAIGSAAKALQPTQTAVR